MHKRRDVRFVRLWNANPVGFISGLKGFSSREAGNKNSRLVLLLKAIV